MWVGEEGRRRRRGRSEEREEGRLSQRKAEEAALVGRKQELQEEGEEGEGE